MQPRKRLVLVGGVHVAADRVLGKADLGSTMFGVENAANGSPGRALSLAEGMTFAP
jgi:hypothetical protein